MTPPIAEPTRITPARAGSTPSTPASAHASRAAATASTTLRSSRRASFGPDDGLGLEPLHLGRDPYGIPARVERLDEVDAAPSCDSRVPGRLRVEPERGDGAEAGDGNATHDARA